MPLELRKRLLNVETTFIGGRPHHRIGDRYQDLKDLGHGAANPAAV